MTRTDLMTRIGLWMLVPLAVMAVAFGVASHSWGTFFAFVPILLFFAAWHASSFASSSSHRPVRIVGFIVNVACGLTALFCLALGAEQVYAVNSSSYPAWLATRDLGTFRGNETDLLNLATMSCKRPGATIYVKDRGLLMIRCGGMTWLGSETYLAHMEAPR